MIILVVAVQDAPQTFDAPLVADTLLRAIDTNHPGRLGLLAEKMTKRFNAELEAKAVEFHPDTNPWPRKNRSATLAGYAKS
jgi:hypothetical protein